MDLWYAHQGTTVYMLTKLPDGSESARQSDPDPQASGALQPLHQLRPCPGRAPGSTGHREGRPF
eukprot:6589933-Prymnesium_polylepis.1